MLYLTCTTITSVDLTHYGVSHAKDWVSVDCGTRYFVMCKVYTDKGGIKLSSHGLSTCTGDYKYLSWVYGVDRKICHEGH